MLDRVRSTLYQAISSPSGDQFRPVKGAKVVLRGVNDLLGKPLDGAEQIERRRAAKERLGQLMNQPTQAKREREIAPVMVYFEKDQRVRELKKIEDTLKGKQIPYERFDVAEDIATREFVQREAKIGRDGFPVVFIGGDAVGDFRALVGLDADGGLVRRVFGR